MRPSDKGILPVGSRRVGKPAIAPKVVGVVASLLLDFKITVSFSEHRQSLPRVEVYEAVATAMGEIRV